MKNIKDKNFLKVNFLNKIVSTIMIAKAQARKKTKRKVFLSFKKLLNQLKKDKIKKIRYKKGTLNFFI